MGQIYIGLDDPARAEVWLKKGLELQPDLDVVHYRLIDLYLSLGEYSKAIEQSQTYLSKLPDYPPAIEFAALAEFLSGHYEKAQGYFQKIGEQPIELGYIYWKAGRKDEARGLFQKNLDRLQKRFKQGDEGPEPRLSMAAIYAVQGDKEEALRWLEKAVDAGSRWYGYLTRYPLFENIRDDERFKRIGDEVKVKVAEMRRRVEQLERDSSK